MITKDDLAKLEKFLKTKRTVQKWDNSKEVVETGYTVYEVMDFLNCSIATAKRRLSMIGATAEQQYYGGINEDYEKYYYKVR